MLQPQRSAISLTEALSKRRSTNTSVAQRTSSSRRCSSSAEFFSVPAPDGAVVGPLGMRAALYAGSLLDTFTERSEHSLADADDRLRRTEGQQRDEPRGSQERTSRDAR